MHAEPTNVTPSETNSQTGVLLSERFAIPAVVALYVPKPRQNPCVSHHAHQSSNPGSPTASFLPSPSCQNAPTAPKRDRRIIARPHRVPAEGNCFFVAPVASDQLKHRT